MEMYYFAIGMSLAIHFRSARSTSADDECDWEKWRVEALIIHNSHASKGLDIQLFSLIPDNIQQQ
jgi:hypothetical protein